MYEYFYQYWVVFLEVQFAATRRWLGTTAGTYFSCVLQFHHDGFSISSRMYVLRTSFSGPRRCVWVFRLSSFDARGPESLWVGVGGFVYTHLRGPVPRFGGTLFLTWDSKSGWVFHWFSAPVRAHPTSQPFSSVFEPHTCISSDFETSQRLFFRILGYIREFLSLLSLFCRGAASLLQDVYQNITTIKLWTQTIVWIHFRTICFFLL